ncbi:SecDF P1 head subdomain-containing protein [Micropruina sonneratiae]|uniref:SecDF P1 head subdomain-containing protein n=1 Tax=Micropruina sonneratiae TaxID=2986940 RepID=UPI0022272BE6|nr:hypothetical protein [Micropruina sp. KQZ13P-5]MCW3157852.1 hypothetical protein [Micropruina sp. KQZ13P-5]
MRRLKLLLGAIVVAAVSSGCTMPTLLGWGPRPTRPLSVHAVIASSPAPCSDAGLVFPDPANESQCLELDAAAFTVQELRSVEARADGSGAWVVTLELVHADAEKFETLTGRIAGQTDPRNRLALVLGGDDLVTAPQVAAPITGGTVQISGNFTQQQAQELVGRLGG